MHDEPKQALAMTEVEHAEASAAVHAGATRASTSDGAGQDLYRQACAACHGPDATGIENLGNSLVESDVLDFPMRRRLPSCARAST